MLFLTSQRNAASRFLRMMAGQLGGSVHLGHLFSYLSQNTIEFEGENLALTDLMEALHTSSGVEEDDDDYEDEEDDADDDDGDAYNGYWGVEGEDEEDEEDEDDEEFNEEDDDDDSGSGSDSDHQGEGMRVAGHEEDDDNAMFGRSYFPGDDIDSPSNSDGEMISEYEDVEDADEEEQDEDDL